MEVVIKSGRRKAQVMEDARLIGQTSYIYEVGSGVVIDGEEHFLTRRVRRFRGTHAARADRGLGRAGSADARVRRPPRAARAVEPDRHVSHLFRGTVDVGEASALLEREGHGDLRLIDNGEAAEGGHTYHLIPATASKEAAVRLHMRARGYEAEECIAVGDSPEDLGWRPWCAASTWWPTPGEAGGPNVTRTESGWGEGFYEAVVAELVGEG